MPGGLLGELQIAKRVVGANVFQNGVEVVSFQVLQKGFIAFAHGVAGPLKYLFFLQIYPEFWSQTVTGILRHLVDNHEILVDLVANLIKKTVRRPGFS